jgi:hypothetical protein
LHCDLLNSPPLLIQRITMLNNKKNTSDLSDPRLARDNSSFDIIKKSFVLSFILNFISLLEIEIFTTSHLIDTFQLLIPEIYFSVIDYLDYYYASGTIYYSLTGLYFVMFVIFYVPIIAFLLIIISKFRKSDTGESMSNPSSANSATSYNEEELTNIYTISKYKVLEHETSKYTSTSISGGSTDIKVIGNSVTSSTTPIRGFVLL